MNIIARCLDPTPLFWKISAGIPHKVFIVACSVKICNTSILIVLYNFPLTWTPRVNIDPYLFLLTSLLLLLLIMWWTGFLGFKGAGQWNHDNTETPTHHDWVVAQIWVELILTVGVQMGPWEKLVVVWRWLGPEVFFWKNCFCIVVSCFSGKSWTLTPRYILSIFVIRLYMIWHVLNNSFLSYFRLNLWLLLIILYIIFEYSMFIRCGIFSIILLILFKVVNSNACILFLRGLSSLPCFISRH